MDIDRGDKFVRFPGSELTIEEKMDSLYHFTTFESFVKIWITKTLKFAPLSRVNDFLEANYSSCYNNINTLLKSDYYEAIRKSYRQISLNMDYDSYTKGCMSPIMWGHYGQGGNGVCIELNRQKLLSNNKSKMYHKPVSYFDPLPKPPTIDEKAIEDIHGFVEYHQNKLFFTKHKSWECENEYRFIKYVEKEGENDTLDIRGAIISIYVTSCINQTSKWVKKLLENDDSVYYKYVHTFPINSTLVIRIDDVLQDMEIQFNHQSKLNNRRNA